MRDSILKYVLALSMLLNFSILGAAGYTHYRQTRHTSALVGSGLKGLTPSGSSARPHFFEALSLKPEQLRQFQEKATLFHTTLDEKKTRIDRLKGVLLGLTRTDKADPEAIEATIAEISEVQQGMQKVVVSHMLEFKSMLDSAQQKKFLDLIESAMATRGEMQCP